MLTETLSKTDVKSIHNRLKEDCIPLFKCDGVAVLLHSNAEVLWFILVPLGSAQATELHQLATTQRSHLNSLADALARYILKTAPFEKVNSGCIGNLVPQLHFHVIGRHREDSCWPNPVWGHLQDSRNYPEAMVQAIRERCLDA